MCRSLAVGLLLMGLSFRGWTRKPPQKLRKMILLSAVLLPCAQKLKRCNNFPEHLYSLMNFWYIKNYKENSFWSHLAKYLEGEGKKWKSVQAEKPCPSVSVQRKETIIQTLSMKKKLFGKSEKDGELITKRHKKDHIRQFPCKREDVYQFAVRRNGAVSTR